ncbi:MAG: peptidoglycan-associated lipoprotein Pal [Pseudobdellovibrionaceae bacterium]
MIRNLALVLAAATLIAGCASKKKTEDAGMDAGAGGSAIESAPMSFDASGSDSGKIDGLKSVNFEYDSSTLTKSAKDILKGNAGWLKNQGNSNMQIEGHCDERGSIEYNLALGERRANSVKAYMVSLGIPAGRLSVISYGEEKPLDTSGSESAFVKNRRANFVPLQ